MSRGKSNSSDDLAWLKRFAEALERYVNEEKSKDAPRWAYQIRYEDAMRFTEGTGRFLRGEAKTLDSALKLKRRGRPVNSYKPENLELAEKARRLQQQGMTLEDITHELYGHRSDPPSVRHIQILIKRFTPAIEEKERKALVDELCRRLHVRSETRHRLRVSRQTRPRLAPQRRKIRIEAIWVDPDGPLTPQDLKKMLGRHRKRRCSE
jgi:DNA-binding transcriptional MerR regulator